MGVAGRGGGRWLAVVAGAGLGEVGLLGAGLCGTGERRVRLGQRALIGGSEGGRGCLVLAQQQPPLEEEVEVEEE